MENKETKERGLVKYVARDGQEITLSFDNIRKYLVQGNKEEVTEQELIYFLAICKSRGLNPFKKDAYLIKFGDDPAAVVTSIDYFRSRAKAQKDCQGWNAGILIKGKDGKIKDSYGLLLDDEELVGGWFEGQPTGWKEPFRVEVNLNGYIKKTKEGKVTRFWQKENQPTMIAKVAESQGLRKLFPDEFQGMYGEEEIARSPIDAEFERMNGEKIDKSPTKEFDEKLPKEIDSSLMQEYLNQAATGNKCTVGEIKEAALGDLDQFIKQFKAWCKKPKPTIGRPAGKVSTGEKPNVPVPPPPAGEEEKKTIWCPNRNEEISTHRCTMCADMAKCPEWDGMAEE